MFKNSIKPNEIQNINSKKNEYQVWSNNQLINWQSKYLDNKIKELVIYVFYKNEIWNTYSFIFDSPQEKFPYPIRYNRVKYDSTY